MKDREHLLILPELHQPDERKEKRYVAEPDISILTTEQRPVFDQLMAFYKDPEQSIGLLRGYAGTGKTFMTDMFIEMILSTQLAKQVKMTAPTNKAVKVMKKMAGYQHVGLDYRTLHSLLGLKEKIDGYGRVLFEPEWGKEPDFGGVDIVIIDEGSMLPNVLFDGTLGEEGKKYNGIYQYAKLSGFKILIVGDPCQIPPVGLPEALVFSEQGIIDYEVNTFDLTTVVRQAADNPIIKVTMAIRGALGRPDVLPIRQDDFDPSTNDGVYYLNSIDQDFFKKLLKTHFDSDHFRADANFMKVVAWRNDTLKTFNKLIRAMLYGKDASKLVLGEKLIANKPIFDDVIEEDGKRVQTILLSNNDEMEIVELKVSTVNYKGAELYYYDTEVQVDGEFGTKRIKVIHDDSEEDLQLIRDYLKGIATECKKGSWEASAAWKDFYAVDKFFADVNYNYAISAHKSQGSTYENVLVLESDIDANRNVRERNKIKYTAFTRARRKVYVAT